ncbi:unnamed protein product [Mycena citricolor]|uniref:SEC7 domain-containing protein n=1 Tax=Mycena citricolor TaxID=2018698 RepID=A0AAD2HIJ7_9AGAR|nr:unnamed protein product [Mycena citricolor]
MEDGPIATPPLSTSLPEEDAAPRSVDTSLVEEETPVVELPLDNSTPQSQEEALEQRDPSPPPVTASEEISAPEEHSQDVEVPDASQPEIPLETPGIPPTPPTKPVTHPIAANGSAVEPSTPGAESQRPSLTISRANNVSVVLITSALETIAASKEAKRSGPLRDSTSRALELVRANQGGDHPQEVFEPLRLACETRNEKLMIASLDCISKLISYSFFAESTPPGSHGLPSPPPSPNPTRRTSVNDSTENLHPPSLVDLVASTIASCHTETTPETVSLQIVKALLSLVLSPTILVHQSSLLKAVRTVYNVFLLSSDPVNQMVAQGGLTQMVHHVFTRCSVSATVHSSDSTRSTASSTLAESSESSTQLSVPEDTKPETRPDDVEAEIDQPVQSNSNGANGHHDDHPESPTDSHSLPDSARHELTMNDLFIKDAFLVFRALCKLTMKPLNPESERDIKSHGMRSKLLSLHLVLTILNSHMPLFVDPAAIIHSNTSHESTTLVQAINQYLCLSLSNNAVSPVPQVFEISVEIFWRVISGMRTKLKKEIEVLLHEIFIPILEMRTSTLKQKAVILGMLSRLCQDPQALVEIYLNYDCDSEAADNIYEHLMNIISKIGSMSSVAVAPKQNEPASPALSPTVNKTQHGGVPPSLSTASLAVSGSMDTSTMGLSEAQLRRQGLECLVTVLRSLVAWGTASGKLSADPVATPSSRSQIGSQNSDETRRNSTAGDSIADRLSAGPSVEALRQPTPDIADDPNRFESAKQKKTTLLEGIKKFNFKPKRGIQFLMETGFIASNAPQDIAQFLLTTDGLNKAMIGEYLGEGEDENVAIMHAFVDLLDFKESPFVDALRLFLQSFRLPGEAQKIDRFMLKFAERYIDGNSSTPFANAGACRLRSGVLCHLAEHGSFQPQVKRRMTKTDFIRNNRGINDNADLPEQFLSEIFDEIASNEIRMKDEIDAATGTTAGQPGLANALANVGRDLQKEAYVLQTSGMANKTEALFRTMTRSQRKGGHEFFSASHFAHVKPMFEVAWIPFLAGLSGPLQDTDDLEVVELCLDGFKSAIRIVCFFDLELERNAFVTTLAKFTFLNNLGEMKTKNMEAIKTLLDIAVTEGNHLKSSWHDVLTCVSQLEHMQLIGGGSESDAGRKGRSRKVPTEELANESRSTHITVATDMVFSLSHYLSGEAIVDFVQALSDVSWEEIQSSGLSQHPRLFSLQKLVEISYYNMNRIRLEWSNLWEILGSHFNKVCCHNNPHVCFFALDSLRQLAMRFLEKEELPHFKFQKDFLKPFEHTMAHNPNPDIQRIATSAFEIVTRLNKDHFGAIVRHGAFADLTVCITEFCKVSKYQKISLLAIGMLRGVIPVMLECPECSWPTAASGGEGPMDDSMIRYWFPVLFGFYDIIMNGEDLEVRRLALDSLFTTLKTYGKSYPVEFWDTVCRELLFPIFAVLKSSQDVSRFNTQEDMSVWLSTTMIQALRDLIDLYTFYFDILERLLDGLLDLLCVCICQENDTLARIGTSCLQQLLENNVQKLSPARWERVATTFVRLFKTTTPHQLFDDSLRIEIDSASPEPSEAAELNGQTILPAPLSPNGERPEMHPSSADRRRVFKQIIVKCVLQLLLIETTNDLLRNDQVYSTMPPDQLLRLMGVLDHSYQFARSFNDNKELRTGLWKVGFMKHLPNLLKQESSSASTLVHVLLRMYYDGRPGHLAARPQIADRLMPLSLTVLRDYNKLRADTQSKNIVAWTPVVGEILDGFCRFDEKTFRGFLSVTYPLATELLGRDLSPEIRLSLKTYFTLVGVTKDIMDRHST